MSKKDKETSFEEWYKKHNEDRTIDECSWFGIITGICLSGFCAYQSLCSIGMVCILFNIIAILGLILIFVGAFLPLKLKPIIKPFKKFFSFIGMIILKLSLIPIYFVITSINAFTHKSYSKKFNFIQWDEVDAINSAYHDFNYTIKNRNKNAIIDILSGVFLVFTNTKMYIVIPIIVMLLTLGLVMFFASSNAVFSFVYTLF